MWRALAYTRNNWGLWNRNALCSTEGRNFKSTRHELFQALEDSTENMWFSFRSVTYTGNYTCDNIQQLLCSQYMCGFCLVLTVNENYLHKHKWIDLCNSNVVYSWEGTWFFKHWLGLTQQQWMCWTCGLAVLGIEIFLVPNIKTTWKRKNVTAQHHW